MDVGRRVERAQDTVGEHGDEVARLARAYDVGLYAPAHGEAGLALEICQAFGRPGDFEAADGIGASLAVEFHALPETHGVAREGGHGPGGVDLEDKAGRVRGGAAGLEQRPLLNDHYVAPA